MALSSLLYNQVIHCIFNHYGNICYKERKKIEKNFTFIHIQNPMRLTLIKLWCGNIFFFQPNKTKQNRKNHYQDRKSYLQINLSLIKIDTTIILWELWNWIKLIVFLFFFCGSCQKKILWIQLFTRHICVSD